MIQADPAVVQRLQHLHVELALGDPIASLSTAPEMSPRVGKGGQWVSVSAIAWAACYIRRPASVMAAVSDCSKHFPFAKNSCLPFAARDSILFKRYRSTPAASMAPATLLRRPAQ